MADREPEKHTEETHVYEQAQTNKLWQKTKDQPYVPLGILGTLAMIGYGVHDYKNRGGMSTSVYIMQYRVKAQSVVVGALTLGVTYTLIRDYIFPKKH